MKWYISLVILLVVLIYIGKDTEHLVISRTLNLGSDVNGKSVQPSLPNRAKEIPLKVPSSDPGIDIFTNNESLDSLISRYQTMAQDEVRQQIYENKYTIKKSNLIEKANIGSITTEERRRLVYLIRVNTALHHVLIKQRLEKN